MKQKVPQDLMTFVASVVEEAMNAAIFGVVVTALVDLRCNAVSLCRDKSLAPPPESFMSLAQKVQNA